MTFLPVVERELRVAARRRGARLVRVLVVTVALGASAVAIKVYGGSSQETGPVLFEALAVLVFIYAGIFGAQITADCMSEEKREGTLGLLFLTDLRGYDVVLGKLAATSIHSLYGMLALAPVLAIPLLMGGVSRAELLRVVLASVNLLLFSLSVGVWSSSVCRRGSRARGLALGATLVVLFGWSMASEFWPRLIPNPGPGNVLSPAYACVLAFDETYLGNQPWEFWLSALITFFYSCVFLGLACWIAPRSWQDVVVKKPAWWRRWPDTVRAGSNRQARLLARNPFLWRASRPESKRVAVWTVLAALAAIGIWALRFDRRGALVGGGLDPTIDMAFLIVAGFVLKCWVAAESGRALGEDRRSGALELLLCTELGPVEIVRGQEAALWRQFAWPIGALFVGNAIFLVMEFQFMSRSVWDKYARSAVLCAHCVVGLFLVMDSLALSWVGMWRGYIARKPHRAAAITVLRILVLPAVLFLVVTSVFLSAGSGFDGVAVLMFWCVLGAGTDIWAFIDREKLLERFRAIASEGCDRRRPVEIPQATPRDLVMVS